MSDPIQAAIRSASHGLSAQSTRLRIASENLANAESVGSTAGADPYQRKLVSFRGVADQETGGDIVQVDQVLRDPAPFRLEHRPGHPAADPRGYVKMPNVDMLVETADMREASRSYSANLQVIKQAKEMISMTIDLLKAT